MMAANKEAVPDGGTAVLYKNDGLDGDRFVYRSDAKQPLEKIDNFEKKGNRILGGTHAISVPESDYPFIYHSVNKL
jgi:hypothetical protein